MRECKLYEDKVKIPLIVTGEVDSVTAIFLKPAAATPKRRDIVVSASVDEPWRRPSESGTEKTSGIRYRFGC